MKMADHHLDFPLVLIAIKSTRDSFSIDAASNAIDPVHESNRSKLNTLSLLELQHLLYARQLHSSTTYTHQHPSNQRWSRCEKQSNPPVSGHRLKEQVRTLDSDGYEGVACHGRSIDKGFSKRVWKGFGIQHACSYTIEEMRTWKQRMCCLGLEDSCFWC